METNKKEKVVSVGITEELRNFLNEWTERTMQEAKEFKEEKKIGIEVKEAIVEIAKNELTKVEKEFEKNPEDQEWFRLMEKADKISDLVRWF